MSVRKKRIIAVVELFITLAIIVYFFFPKNLEGALGLGFGREDLYEIDGYLSVISLQVEENKDVVFLPGTEEFDTLMDLLEEETYWPVYLQKNNVDVELDKLTHLTFVSEKGERMIPISDGRILRITGTDYRERTFRVSEGFQNAILDLMIAQVGKS